MTHNNCHFWPSSGEREVAGFGLDLFASVLMSSWPAGADSEAPTSGSEKQLSNLADDQVSWPRNEAAERQMRLLNHELCFSFLTSRRSQISPASSMFKLFKSKPSNSTKNAKKSARLPGLFSACFGDQQELFRGGGRIHPRSRLRASSPGACWAYDVADLPRVFRYVLVCQHPVLSSATPRTGTGPTLTSQFVVADERSSSGSVVLVLEEFLGPASLLPSSMSLHFLTVTTLGLLRDSPFCPASVGDEALGASESMSSL
ncbi:unnamed protein product [Notodromas monacha]|uniref:Uncharacterized protein n=1 Tax=Notodromas monacha TaxID=399045 RepID=A0A7R9G8L5_9CRUS|nr:unnamed protein product [Notodromas monacha]CAG0912228.1 unnamed protein product [Notodromas monacha]